MKKSKLFFISGLGADHRAFDRIELDGYEKHHLKWVLPERGETLESYARKLAEPVQEAENPIVIGLSLGGMITAEMTTFIPHMRGILISSIKHPSERPFTLKLGQVLPLQGLVPGGVLKAFAPVWPVTQRNTPKEDISHMMAMFRDQHPRFLYWASLAAPRWHPKGDLSRLSHIHGTADRLFPIHKIIDPIVIEGGSHMMVFTKGKEVSAALQQELNRIDHV